MNMMLIAITITITFSKCVGAVALALALLFHASVDCASLRTQAESANVSNANANANLFVRWSKNDDENTIAYLLASLNCPNNTELYKVATEGARCCSKCPSGHIIKTFCRLDGDTECKSCEPNTFSRNGKCEICSICDRIDSNSRTGAECTSSRDTECVCNDGYFKHPTINRCVACSFCAPGSGVKSICNATSDTICEACGPDSFSDRKDNDKYACKRCRSCTFSTASACTPTSDSKCHELRFDSRPPKSAGDQATAIPNTNETMADESDVTRKDDGLIPVYCGIMGLVIISSVIYAVLKQRKQNVRKRKAKAAGPPGRPTLPTRLSLPSQHLSRSASEATAAATAEPLLAVGARTAASGTDWRPPTQSESCCSTGDSVAALCRALDNEPDDGAGVSPWRRLVAELRVEEPEVNAAEYQAASTGSSPLYILLSQLAHSPHAHTRLTNATLCEALMRIGKAELCSIIYNDPLRESRSV